MWQADRFKQALTVVEQDGLLRSRYILDAHTEVVNFCSNDYLGLSQDPDVIHAAQQGLSRWGVGGQASQLVSGYTRSQQQLEQALAAWLQRDACLVFSSGFLANLGLLQVLLSPQSEVVADKWCHASLMDGIRFQSAQLRRYRHLDLVSAEQQAQRFSDSCQDRWWITESVFSMEGDRAPMIELAGLADQYRANLVVDEAHALGVIGSQGRGLVMQLGLNQTQVPVLVGTFGKAFGTNGAFVAGSQLLIDLLQQYSRSLIYTTALPPSIIEATRVSLHKLQQADTQRAWLDKLIKQFQVAAQQHQWSLLASSTPIQPLMVGCARRAQALSQGLLQRGYWVQAIRPPTVPVGASRLRIVFNARHTQDQVQGLIDALSELWEQQ